MTAPIIFALLISLAVIINALLNRINFQFQLKKQNFDKQNFTSNVSWIEHASMVKDRMRKNQASNIETLIGVFLLLIFVFLGGLKYLESLSVSITYSWTSSEFLTGYLFLLMFTALFMLSSEFLTIISVLKRGERPRLKKTALLLILMTLGCFLVYGLFHLLTVYFLASQIAVLVVTLGALLVAMNLVLPWYLRFQLKTTSLDQPVIQKRLEELCHNIRFKFPSMMVIDGNLKKSRCAYVTGIWKREITIHQALIDALSPDEIAATVLHEIGHLKRGHLIIKAAVGLGLMLISLQVILKWIIHPQVAISFGLTPEKSYSLFLLLVFFWMAIAPYINVVNLSVSRIIEYDADAYAARNIDPKHCIKGLKKIVGLLGDHPSFAWPLYNRLKASHPSVSERIAAFQKQIKDPKKP